MDICQIIDNHSHMNKYIFVLIDNFIVIKTLSSI